MCASLYRGACALLLLLSASASAAREVGNMEDILRELEIGRDVFRSAMSQAMGSRLKVTNVDAQYLPQQGVLVSMSVVQPWIDLDEFSEKSIDLNTDVQTLHDVPELVAEIMSELNMVIAPYDPVMLGELRDLRDEQREIRASQRKLRAELREARRQRNRAEGDAAKLDARITELESELDALVDDYAALDADIDDLYASLKERRREPESPADVKSVDEAVAETTCRYGDTFKTVGSQQYLSVLVDLKDSTSYYVFKMENVYACRRGDIDPDRLLERSWQYRRD